MLFPTQQPVTSIAPPILRELVDFAEKYDIIVMHDNLPASWCRQQDLRSFLQLTSFKSVGVEFNSCRRPTGGRRAHMLAWQQQIVSMLRRSSPIWTWHVPALQKARRRRHRHPGLSRAKPGARMKTGGTYWWRAQRYRLADEQRRGHNVCLGEIRINLDQEAFVRELLDRSGVLVTPGAAFGREGEGHVRIALVQDEEAMRDAVRLIAESGILK
jgi:LL-diaminopimelate aminotransferase